MGKQTFKTISGASSQKKSFYDRKRNKDGKKGVKRKKHKIELDPQKMKKYKRGEHISIKRVKDKRLQGKLKITEKNYQQAVQQATRSELLMTEDTGFLEAEDGERTHKFRQDEIVEELDINSAQKHFDLRLDQFSPYKINYTRNGKYLLIGGNKGHLATIDWQNKNLGCELHVKETVRDVSWLHQDQFFAVAQKKYVHIYDTQGIEIHVMKDYQKINRLEFLPYHFLLASVGDGGMLHYLDTSIGKHTSSLRTHLGRCDCMTVNPFNAVVQLGHAAGSVTMWSPLMKEPLVKMLCHRGPVLAIATEKQGVYMATSGLDGCLKVWDIRSYKPVYTYKIMGKAAHDIAISQRGLLATAFGPKINIFKDALSEKQNMPYMTYSIHGADIRSISFCPFEDVLGIGHSKGFSSILVPGAGEANFDALEANPFETHSQRREHEVKMLLEKIQPEMITLNPNELHRVDIADNKTKKKEREDGTEKEEFQPKYKAKGKSSSSKVVQRKQGVRELTQREERQAVMLEVKRKEREKKRKQTPKTQVEQLVPTASALDRFDTKVKFNRK